MWDALKGYGEAGVDFAIALHHWIEAFGAITAVFFLCRAYYLRKGKKNQEYIKLLEERKKMMMLSSKNVIAELKNWKQRLLRMKIDYLMLCYPG